MAVIGTKTAFGIVLTCTGGTSASTLIVDKGTRLDVVGVNFAGAATTDIITIYDGSGVLFAKGFGTTGATNSGSVSFSDAVSLDGLIVTIAGATTGAAIVYCR